MNIKRHLKNRRGQALTEFILTFPLLLIVFLFLLQLFLVMDNATRTEMAVWLGLRGISIPEQNGGFFSVKAKYSQNDIKNYLEQDFWAREGDDVDISYSSSSYFVIKKAEMKIKSRIPYLYQGLDWNLLQKLYAGVVRGGKIEASTKGNILKF